MTTRVRSRDQTIVVPKASITRTMVGTGVTTLVDVGGSSTYPFTESMTDVVTEDFFALEKAKKILPVNPMTHTGVDASNSTDSLFGQTWTQAYYFGGNPYQTTVFGNANAFWCDGWGRSKLTVAPTGSFSESLVPSAPPLAYMLQEARAKAHGEPVDLSTMLAELNKSVDLVKDVHKRTLERARRVIDAAVRLRKGDLNAAYRRMNTASKVADLINIASQIWLEYRFGWRLLVKDIEDLHQLYNTIEHTFDVDYSRGTYELVLAGPLSTIYSQNGCSTLSMGDTSLTSWGKYDFVEYLRVERKVRVGAMVKYTADRPYFGDPFVTAWELVPLSWVADMFVNIGSALKAWSPFIAGLPVHQWMSDDVFYVHGRSMTPGASYGSWPNTYGFVGSNPVLKAEVGWRTKSRVAVGLTAPVLRFNPGIPKVIKLVDLAAVVTQFGNQVVQHATSNVKMNLQWFR